MGLQAMELTNPLLAYGTIAPTNLQGSKAIDGILVSTHLANQVQGGLLRWAELCGSDGHHPIWLELPLDSFGRLSKLKQPNIRWLQCQHPTIRTRFIKGLKQSYKEHNVKHRVAKLSTVSKWKDKHYAEWERLDWIKTAAMLAAEDKCRTLRLGEVPWTPALHKTGSFLRFWATFTKHLSQNIRNTWLLLRLCKDANLLGARQFYSYSTEEARQEITQSWAKYKAMKAAHINNDARGKWLDK